MLKTIPDFPDYAINEEGWVWSKPRRIADGRYRRGQWLSPRTGRGNLLYVAFWQDDRAYHRAVHRLILETYVGPCPFGMVARHINGKPSDNRLENLMWDTRSVIIKKAADRGTFYQCGYKGVKGEASNNAKLTETDVRGIDAMYRTRLFRQVEIAEQYGIWQGTVSAIIRRKSWKHLWAS
jgi:hypothetical protein